MISRKTSLLVDNDECLGAPCKDNSTCKNTPGDYICQCERGKKYDRATSLCKRESLL